MNMAMGQPQPRLPFVSPTNTHLGHYLILPYIHMHALHTLKWKVEVRDEGLECQRQSLDSKRKREKCND
jgi:hypothetical protein